MANIMFFVGGTIIHHRENLLTDVDLKCAKKSLKAGDVVLVGGKRRFSSLVIRGPVTHAMLYIGSRRFIHAVVDGIEIDSLHAVFCEYDTLVILRPIDVDKKKIKKALRYALSRVGVPFDFEFNNNPEALYCSELICKVFKYADIKTGLNISGKSAIHPTKFVNRHFKIVFLSHSLGLKKGTLIIK